MDHPDITRMERTGLKPFEKYWYDTKENDSWLDWEYEDDDEDID